MSDDNQQEEKNQEQLQQDLELATNNWKRALADFENYKRRKEGESKELVEFAREVTVAKLLPTIDSLELALRHMPVLANKQISESANKQDSQSADQLINLSADDQFPQQYQNWQTGVNGIVIQLDKVLEELGVKKIEALGKKFDPHFHEAVREVETEAEDGTVVEELQSGFELNGKVIRPSQVVISKKTNK